MGEPPDRMEGTAATSSGVTTVQKVVMYQSRYWHCLYPKDYERGLCSSFILGLLLISEGLSSDLGAERMHGKLLLLRRLDKPFKDPQMSSEPIKAKICTIRIR